MWGFLKLLASAFCGAALLYILLYHFSVNLPAARPERPPGELNVSYTDLVTVMLTGVTVVLAAVGIGVGVVAAYTITGLKDDAKAYVNEAVDDQMKDVKKQLDQIETNIEEKVAAIAYGVGRNLDDDADEDTEDR